MNIEPDLSNKVDIVQNAVNLWHVLFGEAKPKVAALAALETVNPRMTATLDAAALCKMVDRGQITGCLMDGPLAFDNAVSRDAAREKGIVPGYGIMGPVKAAPLHQLVTIEQVGEMAAFLLSDRARFVTGQTIYVDSGYNAVT